MAVPISTRSFCRISLVLGLVYYGRVVSATQVNQNLQAPLGTARSVSGFRTDLLAEGWQGQHHFLLGTQLLNIVLKEGNDRIIDFAGRRTPQVSSYHIPHFLVHLLEGQAAVAQQGHTVYALQPFWQTLGFRHARAYSRGLVVTTPSERNQQCSHLNGSGPGRYNGAEPQLSLTSSTYRRHFRPPRVPFLNRPETMGSVEATPEVCTPVSAFLKLVYLALTAQVGDDKAEVLHDCRQGSVAATRSPNGPASSSAGNVWPGGAAAHKEEDCVLCR